MKDQSNVTNQKFSNKFSIAKFCRHF